MRSACRRLLVGLVLLAGLETALRAADSRDLVVIPQSAQAVLMARDEKVTLKAVYAGSLASVRSGVYDHDEAGSLCAIGDGTPGDGFVTALTALQDGSYVLVVGANGSGESVYGQATAGPIPATLTTCP